MSNKALERAKKLKLDEFYTLLEDIELELNNYKDQFYNKTILCNCDDPFKSNFFKYFYSNFNELGIKKLIVTGVSEDYVVRSKDCEIFGKLRNVNNESHAVIVDKVTDDPYKNLIVLRNDSKYHAGDFRSTQCVEYLKQADIAVTNPPFSLFRDYVAQLMEYNKKFLVVSNKNTITYVDISKLFLKNKIRLGINNIRNFNNRGVLVRFGNVWWLTNLDVKKYNEMIPLHKRYNELEYPKYDNYDAIEISRVSDIPMDYYGLMGVPITFLDKYNPGQFEIIGIFGEGTFGKELGAVRTEVCRSINKYSNGPVINKKSYIKE